MEEYCKGRIQAEQKIFKQLKQPVLKVVNMIRMCMLLL